jgi:hypothetical protein
MSELEERGCLRRLLTPEPAARDASPGAVVDAPVYVSDPRYGPHMLLSVGINHNIPRLVTHPDHEEFLLIGDGRTMRPLILILSRLPRAELEQRAKARSLAPTDLVAIELVYNDPALSFFTMHSGTPHCEVALDGPAGVPCFFVTEARDLPSQAVDLGGIVLTVTR